MITDATEADVPALAEMLRELNACHIDFAPHRLHGDGTPTALQGVFRTAMGQGARVLIYRTEGVARGYLLWRIQDRPADALSRPLRRAVLDHIYVEPSWRRRGLGGRLIARFEDDSRAEGCLSWVAEVFAINRASQALMAHKGAQRIVERFEKRYQ